MKKLLVIAIFSFFISCTKDTSPVQGSSGQQTCLQTKINSFSSGNYACPTGANVKEYLFQNSTVYVFDPGNCMADMTSEVINSDCQTLGYLGGFAGNILINSEDFSNATFLRTVWTN
jgi:hypothetical protein